MSKYLARRYFVSHFGSTAIPGMLAKPVVDMMCIVKDIH
ncbi:GrpB family protein [Oceanobacillus sp. 1P07AA]